MTPWLEDADLRLYHGDALEVLRELPDRSIHMCCTSPPFYGLRNYDVDGQIGLEDSPDEWVARLVDVFREVRRVLRDDGTLWIEIGDSFLSGGSRKIREDEVLDVWESAGEEEREGQVPAVLPAGVQGDVLRRPGEPRQPLNEGAGVPRQTSGAPVGADARTSAGDASAGDGNVGREVPVLRGDASGVPDGGSRPERREQRSETGPPPSDAADRSGGVPAGSLSSSVLELQRRQAFRGRLPSPADLAPKNLLGQPWRLAFALQDDGWILRSEIIWMKPNPMPESVTDRPTKAHSTVFLLSKQPRYFYDADAIRQPSKDPEDDLRRVRGDMNGYAKKHTQGGTSSFQTKDIDKVAARIASGANARSVWSIPTEPTPFAHFATWPRKLVARMILAGTSERGCCPECGAPWVRDTERVDTGQRQKMADGWDTGAGGHGTIHRNGREAGESGVPVLARSTVGWSPSCAHDHPPVPCTVLDPFAGSGTTLLVGRQLGRHSVGIELSESYCKIAANRLAQLSLLSELTS